MISFLLCLSFLTGTYSFTFPRNSLHRCMLDTSLSAVSYDVVSEIGYSVSVTKPMGVVFGENREPFGGLVIDEVDPDMNGGASGLRVGDQLLSVNGQVTVGDSFDVAMSLLVGSSDPLELQLYRGSAKQLYTIIANQGGFLEEEEEEEVIMDESYESPVVMDVSAFSEEDDEPLNAKDFFNGLKKIGSTVLEGSGKEKEAKKGLFGGMFASEPIQLDGDDASTIK